MLKTSNVIKYIYIIFFSLIVFLAGCNKPEYNWDVIGYVASIYSMHGLKGEELRVATYTDVESSVSKKSFHHLIEGSYNSTVYADSKALEQQLPFYRIRYLYLVLCDSLSGFLGSVSFSTVVVSALFSSLIYLTVSFYFINNSSLIVLMPLVMGYFGITELARLSTPDSMAIFLALVAVLYFNSARLLTLILVSIIPLVRTDYVILVAILFLYRFFNGGRKYEYVFFVISILLYFVVNRYADNYGYFVIFNFTLIPNELKAYPAEMLLSKNPVDYMLAYQHGFEKLLSSKFIILYLLAGFIYFGRRLNEMSSRMAVIPACFIMLHFVAFPAAFDRNYMFAHILLGIYVFSFFILDAKNRKRALPISN